MTINDKLLISVLKSLLESKYSKNTEIPTGKPSTSGRPKPKSPALKVARSDEEEENLDENNSEYLKKLAEYERKKRNRDALAMVSAGIGSPPGTEAGNFREPRKPKPPRAPKARRKRKPNREDSSTNWKDRILDMLLETFLGTSRDYVARALSREGKGKSMLHRSKLGKALASVINKQPKVIKARAEKKAADDAQEKANRAKGGNSNLNRSYGRPPEPDYDY